VRPGRQQVAESVRQGVHIGLVAAGRHIAAMIGKIDPDRYGIVHIVTMTKD